MNKSVLTIGLMLTLLIDLHSEIFNGFELDMRDQKKKIEVLVKYLESETPGKKPGNISRKLKSARLAYKKIHQNYLAT